MRLICVHYLTPPALYALPACEDERLGMTGVCGEDDYEQGLDQWWLCFFGSEAQVAFKVWGSQPHGSIHIHERLYHNVDCILWQIALSAVHGAAPCLKFPVNYCRAGAM